MTHKKIYLILFSLFAFTLKGFAQLDAFVSILKNPLPDTITCPGTYPVQVQIENYGVDDITDLDIGWSVDGILQTPATWTGLITMGNSAVVDLSAAYVFDQGSSPDIRIWLNSVNTIADDDQSNDTLDKVVTFFSVFVPQFYYGGCTLYLLNISDFDHYVWQFNGFPDPDAPLSNNYQPHNAGIYSVIGTTSDGCLSIPDSGLTLTPHSFSIVASGVISFCQGDSVGLSVSTDATINTYDWSTSETTSSIYFSDSDWVMVSCNTSDFCVLTDSVFITVNPLPQPMVTQINDTMLVCNIADGNQWQLNGINIGGANDDTLSTLTLNNGDVICCINTSLQACQGTDCINVIISMEEKIEKSFSLSLFPNPATDKLTIASETSLKEYSVTDVLGKEIIFGNFDTAPFTLSLGDIAHGVYYVKVKTQNSFRVMPFVKN